MIRIFGMYTGRLMERPAPHSYPEPKPGECVKLTVHLQTLQTLEQRDTAS